MSLPYIVWDDCGNECFIFALVDSADIYGVSSITITDNIPTPSRNVAILLSENLTIEQVDTLFSKLKKIYVDIDEDSIPSQLKELLEEYKEKVVKGSGARGYRDYYLLVKDKSYRIMLVH